MARPENWVTLLDRFLIERRAMAFAWGSNDCACFAAAWVALMHGVNPMTELLLPAYDNERDAARLMRQHGGLRRLACAYFGSPIVSRLGAQRGDVVMIANARRNVLGVCVGGEVAGPGAKGIEFLPLSDAVAAWRV